MVIKRAEAKQAIHFLAGRYCLGRIIGGENKNSAAGEMYSLFASAPQAKLFAPESQSVFRRLCSRA